MFAWPASQHWRLGVGLIIAQVVIGLGLAIADHYTERNRQHAAAADALERLVPLYAARYAPLLESGDEAAIFARVRDDAELADVRLTIILPTGRVVGDSGAHPASLDNHRVRAEVASALETGQGRSSRFSQSMRRSMLYAARRVDDEQGNPLGVVRASIAVADIETAAGHLVQPIIAGTVGLVLVTIVGVGLSRRRLTATLERIAADAAEFGRGELDHDFQDDGNADLDGLVRAINAMAENVGKRIAELERQRHEEEAILQAMTSGVIAIDHEHRVINLNTTAERILRATISEAKGRLLEEITRAPELLQFISKAMAQASPDGYAGEFTLAGKPPMTVHAIAETLPRDADEPAGLLVLMEDVTRIRRLETLRSDFAANVSHELRTPITNLKGYVETLLEVGIEDEAQLRRFLNIIKHNSDRLAAIVDDVMMLTELERPRDEAAFEQEWTALSGIIREVARQAAPAASAKQIIIQTHVEEGLSAMLHARLIGQALGNLVSNAINYSPRATTVTIRAESLGETHVVLSVADQGPGIPQVHRERLFERFYRADSARSRALGGTGLGLAIVKHITLAHGGKIELDSEVGRGSTFRMVLPRSGAVSRPAKSSPFPHRA